MKKKWIVPVAIIIVVLLGAGCFVFLKLQKSPEKKQPVAVLKAKKMPSTVLTDYKDAAGFSFSYPHDIDIKPHESTDSAVYSDVTFNSSDAPGQVHVLISDTKIPTLDKWLVQNNISSASATITDSTFGSLPAKEIVQKDSTTLVAIDNGILFIMTVNPSSTSEKKYWDTVYASLKKSFAFQAPQAATQDNSAPATDNSGDVSDEGEEVIE